MNDLDTGLDRPDSKSSANSISAALYETGDPTLLNAKRNFCVFSPKFGEIFFNSSPPRGMATPFQFNGWT